MRKMTTCCQSSGFNAAILSRIFQLKYKENDDSEKKKMCNDYKEKTNIERLYFRFMHNEDENLELCFYHLNELK